MLGALESVAVEYPVEQKRGYDHSGSVWAAGWIELALSRKVDASLSASAEPDDALAALRAQGIDYVVVNEGSIRFWLRFDEEDRLVEARERFDDLIPLLETVHREGTDDRTDIVIYRVP